MTYAQGLWRMALVDFDRSSFEQQIELFLSGLGL
jgi:TetR/AcrR family transcriptional repressor of nem operon